MPDRDTERANHRATPPAYGMALSAPRAAAPAGEWREDLRLFAYAWAAGFVFFMVMLA